MKGSSDNDLVRAGHGAIHEDNRSNFCYRHSCYGSLGWPASLSAVIPRRRGRVRLLHVEVAEPFGPGHGLEQVEDLELPVLACPSATMKIS